jgi:hypothetical protein
MDTEWGFRKAGTQRKHARHCHVTWGTTRVQHIEFCNCDEIACKA